MQSSEGCVATFTSPYSSSSMNDSFQIVSQESVEPEPADNDAAAACEQRNHISLTEQDEAAPCHSGELGTGESTTCDVTTPLGNAPVPKPRTLLLHTLPTESVVPYDICSITHPDRTSSIEHGVPVGSPPTPRPRPRSGEQKKKLEQEIKQRLEELAAAQSCASRLEEQLNRANEKISELELRNSDLEMQAQPVVDVEASLRQRDVDLQQAREQSLQLQQVVRAKEAVLREKESLLQRRDSRIVGLEVEVNTLKRPNDPKKRLEVRLSESIGKVMELESELCLLKKEREECDREREEDRTTIENLEKQKMELKSEGDRERREWEVAQGRYERQVGQLQTERDNLEAEKLHMVGEEIQQLQKERTSLQQEGERLRVALKLVGEQLEQETEKVKLAEQNREMIQCELQEQLKQQSQESERLSQLVTRHQEQCDSLERRLGEVQQECEGLKQELAIASAARDVAELALKTEQSTSQKLQKDCDELKQTCEDYTGEINSLLRDLTDHANTIKTLEEKRGALQQQGDGLRRKFAETQEQCRQLREELGRVQEREKRLQTQRDRLQNREEIMDLQLKQYMCDFEEERAAREKMSKVQRHLEAREKDLTDQIAQLRQQVNALSSEKNDLTFQNEQQRLQLQQLQQQ